MRHACTTHPNIRLRITKGGIGVISRTDTSLSYVCSRILGKPNYIMRKIYGSSLQVFSYCQCCLYNFFSLRMPSASDKYAIRIRFLPFVYQLHPIRIRCASCSLRCVCHLHPIGIRNAYDSYHTYAKRIHQVGNSSVTSIPIAPAILLFKWLGTG